MKRIIYAAVPAVGLLIAACGSPKALDDLPVDRQNVIEGEVTVWLAPDEFPNIAWFCNGPTGVYLNTRDSGALMEIVPDDPACTDGEGER